MEITSWSFSTLSAYEKCPYSLILRAEHKIPPNKHMQRGIDIHKAIECFLNNTGDLPQLEYFTEEIKELKQLMAIPEATYGLTKIWTPETDFKLAHGKCILDAIVINQSIKIIDFKTGKQSPLKHMDQAQIYAIATHIWYPEIERIDTEFWYLDLGKVAKYRFTPKELTKYQQILEARITRLMNDTEFKPRPSKYNCRWCAYKQLCWFAPDD